MTGGNSSRERASTPYCSFAHSLASKTPPPPVCHVHGLRNVPEADPTAEPVITTVLLSSNYEPAQYLHHASHAHNPKRGSDYYPHFYSRLPEHKSKVKQRVTVELGSKPRLSGARVHTLHQHLAVTMPEKDTGFVCFLKDT